MDYEPTNRRPIGDVFRKTANVAVQFCVSRGISADAVSYGSMVAAALAGLCFFFAQHHPILLFIAPGFCYLRLWCNMLDGMVALESKTASLRGEILNDVPDRLSDVMIFVGVAHCGFVHPVLGYGGAIGALLVAYIGVFGQAVGVQREFSGVMSKPWRMVALHVGAWAMLGAEWLNQPAGIGRFTLFDYALLVVIIGCVQSFGIRLRRIIAALDKKNAA